MSSRVDFTSQEFFRDPTAAGEGCVGGGSDAAAAKQFFRGNARDCERHDRSRCRPLSRTPWLGYRRLRAGLTGIGNATGRPLLPTMRWTSRST